MSPNKVLPLHPAALQLPFWLDDQDDDDDGGHDGGPGDGGGPDADAEKT